MGFKNSGSQEIKKTKPNNNKKRILVPVQSLLFVNEITRHPALPGILIGMRSLQGSITI